MQEACIEILKESCSVGARMVQEYYARNRHNVKNVAKFWAGLVARKYQVIAIRKLSFCKFMQVT